MDWFRMYSDMPNDPKVGTLSDSQFRTWVELLCFAGKEANGGDTGVTTDMANWAMRRNVTEDVTVLLHRGLLSLHQPTNNIIISKWDKRQMRSDTSNERVRKYREKNKRNVTETLLKQKCNAPEKIREEKIREDNNKEYSPEFEEFWAAYPAKIGKGAAYASFKKQKLGNGKLPTVLLAIETWKNSRQWAEGYVQHPTTWINQKCYDDSPEQVAGDKKGDRYACVFG